ncbi:MAG: ABC transporter ATP-binding protein [Pseudomonadota bacterium]|jgi:ABC-type branched-subunit amino acid transport system ATPase component
MLTVNDIHVAFQKTKVLNGVSLSVSSGETVGIIGPNGSGKTTFFNTLSGFARPAAGSLTLNGEDITSTSADYRAKRGMGRVFQNFGIFKEMTLLENLLVALEARGSLLSALVPWGGESRANRAKALELLDEIHLVSRANQKAGSLSGGQMRLLEIVRVLATGADLLLLDEPTAGVSPRMKEEVALFINKVQGMGKTVLVIEHDITFIQKFCKRIVVLESGTVVLDDTPERVCADERLQEVYFGKRAAG